MFTAESSMKKKKNLECEKKNNFECEKNNLELFYFLLTDSGIILAKYLLGLVFPCWFPLQPPLALLYMLTDVCEKTNVII